MDLEIPAEGELGSFRWITINGVVVVTKDGHQVADFYGADALLNAQLFLATQQS